MSGLLELLADDALGLVVSGARPGMLVLDYDGTLAPFCADRDLAVPYLGVREALSRIPVAGPGRFAIVSGRPWSDIPPLLGLSEQPEIWGCHGWQRFRPGIGTTSGELPPRQRQALAQAAELASRFIPASAVELKPFSLALHWRGIDEPRLRRAEAAMGPGLVEIIQAFDLETLEFEQGLELRPAGMNKSAAIKTLRAEEPFAALFYLGDDATDEDAFFALDREGRGVLVRDEPRPTNAAYWLRPPDELLVFLNRWAAVCGG